MCGKLDEARQPAISGSLNGSYQVIHRLSRSRAFAE
jgi:hypothetical protein